MRGAIHDYFAADHERLDGLARRAVADPAGLDREAFDEFRRGLLRHIGMEERFLFPAVRRAIAGGPAVDLRRFRVEHAAITSLLVGTPDAALLLEIRSILTPHDDAEDGPGGLYDVCDDLLGSDADSVLARVRAYPTPRLRPYQDHPRVLRTARDALRMATSGTRPGPGDGGA
jgi:hypothetical protein